MSIDASKLPAYAQRHIANLEEKVALLEAALEEEEPTRISYNPTVDTRKFIPEHTHILMGGFYVQLSEGGNLIITHRNGPIAIHPESSNRATISETATL